ncbi:MAG: photosystem I reaction center subunit IX [Oscillatoria sp. PMC 1068.18]|nr:photosystem I reaction center subunit IX [Oscillatoria sp. PMC 1076.18]MEC4987465.1 photosystem I reaction center subunit IX [Oscillatoria sp. PMC 1068.18]
MKNLLTFLSTAPVLFMAMMTVTAGILIEFNRFFPDLLFHPMP